MKDNLSYVDVGNGSQISCGFLISEIFGYINTRAYTINSIQTGRIQVSWPLNLSHGIRYVELSLVFSHGTAAVSKNSNQRLYIFTLECALSSDSPFKFGKLVSTVLQPFLAPVSPRH
jgi:hypothetical protein